MFHGVRHSHFSISKASSGAFTSYYYAVLFLAKPTIQTKTTRPQSYDRRTTERPEGIKAQIYKIAQSYLTSPAINTREAQIIQNQKVQKPLVSTERYGKSFWIGIMLGLMVVGLGLVSVRSQSLDIVQPSSHAWTSA